MTFEDFSAMSNKDEERPPPYAPNMGYGAVPPPTYNESNARPPNVQGYPPNSHIVGSGYQPGYQPLPNYRQSQPVRVTNVVVVGGCPACRVGHLEEEFTLAGVLLAILFFPLGMLCCLLMKVKRCQNCGATFG